MTGLTCPKCHGEMRQYERGGVVIDQCGDCRGVFLDRGELERLAGAENSWFDRGFSEPRYDQPRYEEPRHPQRGYGQPYPQRRRKSFLEELFD